MDVHKSANFVFQFVKPILHTITYLIQYTALVIQLWSVKYTTNTLRYAEISSISILSHEAMQAIAIVRLYENKLFQIAFKRI